MALVSALCVGLAVYVTAPKAPAGGEGPTGTYTASAEGFQSEVTVTATFDKGVITDVVLDVSGETAGFGADAGETLAENIKAAGNDQFDGVSGVTYTSDAARAAMADILAQASAGGGAATYTATAEGFQSEVTLTVTFDGDTITDVVLDVSGETAGFGADAGETLAENIKAAGNDQFDGVSGVTYTSDAARAAMADILAQKG